MVLFLYDWNVFYFCKTVNCVIIMNSTDQNFMSLQLQNFNLQTVAFYRQLSFTYSLHFLKSIHLNFSKYYLVLKP